jgi:uncharacterized protein YggE
MKYILTVSLLSLSSALWAQFGGNQTYGNQRSHQPSPALKCRGTDSTLTVYASVMLQQPAEVFLLTLGVSQEGKTARECMNTINERIGRLSKALQQLGIKNDAVFVDFIAQNKLYDYQLSDKQAEQVEGIEVKKNIIIRLEKYALIDQILLLAAEENIHDIIKLDYLDLNPEKIQQRLYKEALDIAERRKDQYLRTQGRKTRGLPAVSEQFTASFPKDQYEQYRAFESAEVNTYSENYVRKSARKSATFYYESLDHSSFDKIIGLDRPEVGIQYVFFLELHYQLVTSE